MGLVKGMLINDWFLCKPHCEENEVWIGRENIPLSYKVHLNTRNDTFWMNLQPRKRDFSPEVRGEMRWISGWIKSRPLTPRPGIHFPSSTCCYILKQVGRKIVESQYIQSSLFQNVSMTTIFLFVAFSCRNITVRMLWLSAVNTVWKTCGYVWWHVTVCRYYIIS